METVKKGLRKLEIDTAPATLTWPENEVIINDNRAPDDRIQDWKLEKSTSNKRYSTSSVTEPYISISSPVDAAELKRSTSTGAQLYSKRNSQAASNVIDTDTKGVSPKKKWFRQLPRMTVKRTQSSPSNRCKGDSVEPPDPPPQLLFNLSWSTENNTAPPPTPWSSYSFSTPTSPAISRDNSSIALDKLAMTNMETPSSSSSSSTATVEEEPTTPVRNLLRRNSCPDYFSDISNLVTKEVSVIPETCITTAKPKTKNPCRAKSVKLFCSSNRLPTINSELTHKRGASVGTFPQPLPFSTPSKSSTASSPTHAKSSISSECTDIQHQYKPLLFKVYTPDKNQLVMDFANIKPRTVKLRRRINLKAEQKAIYHWQNELLLALSKSHPSKPKRAIPPEKKSRYNLTRKFILREFYTTEINFWNQLNYTKVMYCDALQSALENNAISGKSGDMDWFANLQELMVFSFTLISRMRQFDDSNWIDANVVWANDCSMADDIHIGLVLNDMAESMVTFLRCALDYKANRKLLDQRHSNKSYSQYKEKLALRKETRQFTLRDYLIIPIQRITRYGLLLADLEKHTEPMHPDYENIRIAQNVVNSLASAMNFAQK